MTEDGPVGAEYPRLTLAITTYDRPDYLREALDSIAAQTFRDYRVVVLDNASKANYSDVRFNAAPLEYVRRPKNLGASGNIIAALAERRDSEFLMVFHDDDLMHPRTLEWSVAALDAAPEATFSATEYIDFADGEDPPTAAWADLVEPVSERLRGQSDLVLSFMRYRPIAFSSVVYRTSALRTVEPHFDRYDMYWDRPYLLDLAADAVSVLLPAPLVMYRGHGGQDSKSDVLTPKTVMALMERFREALPAPRSDADSKLFMEYSTHFILGAYGRMAPGHRAGLRAYLHEAKHRGLFGYGAMHKAEWIQWARSAGLDELVDAAVKTKKALKP